MKFCSKCGAKQEESRKFCASCGNPLHTQSASSKETDTTFANNQESSNQLPKKPMTKKKKLLIVSLVVMVALAFGIHKYLENLYSPEALVSSLTEAIEEKDVDSAKKVLDFIAFDKDFSDKEIKSYLTYLNNYKEEIGEEIKFSLREPESSGEFPTVSVDNNELLQVVKGKKKFGIYQQYKVEVKPFNLVVSSNLENVTVEISGKKEKMNEDSKTFKKMLPMDMKIKGTYKGAYTELETEASLDSSEFYRNVMEVDLEFDAEYVDVYSNEYDATLFVNGKSTGLKIDDIYNFGPVKTDGSMVLHAEVKTDKGTIKTNEVKIVSEDDVYLEFDESELYPSEEEETSTNDAVATSEATKDELQSFISDYLSYGTSVINEGGFSVVESFHHPDRKSYDESKEYIDYLYEKDITETLISVELVDYEVTDNSYLLYTVDEFDIYYPDGTKRKKYDSVYKIVVENGKIYVWSLEDTKEI